MEPNYWAFEQKQTYSKHLTGYRTVTPDDVVNLFHSYIVIFIITPNWPTSYR